MKIGILWDLDGTLLDTLEDLKDALNYALRYHHCPERSLDEVRQFVGNGAARLIWLAVPHGETAPTWEAVLDTFHTYYQTHCRLKTKPYDGILEAMDVLGQRYPMAVVSNKPDAAVKKLCPEYFGSIYARGESADCPRKPAPDMVYKAMEALGVDRCIYVGDSEVDIATAKNAGVPCLSVLWGFRDRDVLTEAGAEYFCQSPAQLPEIIDRIAAQLGA